MSLGNPKVYPHTKLGIPTSNNIGDMLWTWLRDAHTDGQFKNYGGIKIISIKDTPKVELANPFCIFKLMFMPHTACLKKSKVSID